MNRRIAMTIACVVLTASLSAMADPSLRGTGTIVAYQQTDPAADAAAPSEPSGPFVAALRDARHALTNLRLDTPTDELDDAARLWAAQLIRQLETIGGTPATNLRVRIEHELTTRPTDVLVSSPPDAIVFEHRFIDNPVTPHHAFTATINGHEHTLVFVELEGSFLATTEVSIGLFIDVVEQLDRWSQATALIEPFDPVADPRPGPHAWTWSDTPNGPRILPTEHWLYLPPDSPARFTANVRRISPTDNARPSRDTPMQHLSPDAAAWFANLLNCRLPHSGEWVMAHNLERFAADGDGANPNLRDATWNEARARAEVMRSQRAVPGHPADPADGAFDPRLVSERSPAGYDDGRLFLDVVASPDTGRSLLPSGGFHHLTGNVWEMVYSGAAVTPERWNGFVVAWPDWGPAGVSRMLDRAEQTLGGGAHVIGWSAMSSTAEAVDQPIPFELRSRKWGYADVGFRLAFSPSPQRLVDRLRDVLDEAARGSG